MQNKLIIGTVIGFWLIGLSITDETPGWVGAALFVFAFLTIAGLVAFLMTRDRVRWVGNHRAKRHDERAEEL
jgi:hypothetical protein